MATKIDKKITGYRVTTPAAAPEAPKELMDENVKRPEHLPGSTYKIKTPQSEHALYVTINHMLLNEGTEHESLVPYEIFVNSKNMEHFQWVLALTRVISAVFRKGGDACFLVEELKAVFDPRGGYFKRGGVFMPSLVAELGWVLESHFKSIGLIQVEVDEHQQAFIAAKRAEIEAQQTESGFPESATLCSKCSTKAVVVSDGCAVCLNCGESRCH